jgi:hypothetical protein
MEGHKRRSIPGRIKDCFIITKGYWKAIFRTVTDYNLFYTPHYSTEEEQIENLNEGILSFMKTLAEKDQLHDAPTKTERFGKWYELIVGIGNDNTLSVCLSDGDLEALKVYRRT